MRRFYQKAPGGPSSREPPDDDVVDLHGLGARHWVVLGLLAEHAVLDTVQAAALLFGSRPAAVRCLGVLVRSGLVWRFVFDDDPTHRAYYEPSPAGLRVLAARLAGAGRPVPVGLGTAHPGQLVVNDLHAGLVAVGRASQGTAWLHTWRRGVDTALWLHGLGISRVQPRAYGCGCKTAGPRGSCCTSTTRRHHSAGHRDGRATRSMATGATRTGYPPPVYS